MPHELNLTMTATTGRPWLPYLRRHLRASHALLSGPPAELSVALVGDTRMSRLHKQFMGIAGPTDVLTFELDRDARGRVVDGEIVVCVPEARRAAARLGTHPKQETLLYALHGLLHLCGFDDRTESDHRIMHRKEDDILSRLGIGPVFAPSAQRLSRKREMHP
jgi:probable rRNA maturation factor